MAAFWLQCWLHRLNDFALKIHTNQIHGVRGFGAEPLGHENQVLINRISTLIKETPKDLPSPFFRVSLRREDGYL